MTSIINVLFHSMMMDGIELDLQRIEQTNSHLILLPEQEKRKLKVREIRCLWIAPSENFAPLAVQRSGELPRLIRYILNASGSLVESSELISYLLFEPSYCTQLVEIGYADGMREKENIQRFFGQNMKLLSGQV